VYKFILQQGRNIVSLDETGFICNDLPIRGYGLRGKRLHAVKHIPKRFKTSVVCAIRHGPPLHASFKGNVNGTSFLSFFDDLSRNMTRGTVVILDNISFHKSKAVTDISRTRGVELLFTPPYSPECNPVENYFSVLKNVMRRQMLDYHDLTTDDQFNDLVDGVILRVSSSHSYERYFDFTGE
jgi:transposase